ncbi:MAG TPA: TonB-dependent receptor [Bryobacteraceae bacterium]
MSFIAGVKALSLRSTFRKAGILWLIAAGASALMGQTATGNIVGRVTDPTQAAMGGVEVTATNPEKGLTFRTVTEQDGMYRFFYLAPATYRLTFAHPGFSTLERANVLLQSNESPEVDVQLSVGSVVQKTEVTADSPLVETATSTTGTQLAGKEMNTLPIMQRYTWMSMYLMPDVTSMNGFHIDGMRDRGLGYSLDGITGTQPVVGGEATNTTVSTTANAIEEVKMASTVLPAEFGHSAGGLLSATYKSGTNRLHWEGEDRYVNNDMLHRAYFNLGNAPFSYHELASVASGPVFIPKVYNGKNRTFFLFGWSMHRERYNQSVFTTVPTPDELNGDFSFGGKGYPIYDPATTKQVNGLWSNSPFPNNMIPKSRFNPAVVSFLSHSPWSVPNVPGAALTATGPVQNYTTTSTYYSYRYRYDYKIDHNFSDKNRMFGRASEVINRAVGNQIGINWGILDGTAVLQPVNQENVAFSDTEVFSPTFLSETRLGFNRWHLSRNPPGLNANWAQQFGIPNVSGVTFPTFDDSNGNNFFTTSFPGGVLSQMTQSYVLQENITKIVNQHSFRMGWEIQRSVGDVYPQAQPGGVFYFGGTGTPFNGLGSITPNTGNDFAAFLLGSVTKATFSTDLANWLPRWWSNAVYFQDDWTFNRRLTLNLGMRWSNESPFETKYDQQSQFNPTTTDPLTGLPGAITHPNGALAAGNYNHFQPRVGAAYRIRDNLVFRGGFGLTTIDLFAPVLAQNFEEYTSNVTVQQPSGNPSPAFFLNQGPGQLNFNVLPNGTSPFVGSNCNGTSITGCASRTAERIDPNLHNAYAMNWNSTVQWEFRPEWMLEANYIGSAGVGLLEGWNINTIPLNISSDPNTLKAIFANQQPYRPFPNFGEIDQWGNFGHSTYHAGTVKLIKRFSHGLTFTTFYTRSKAIDECDNDKVCTGETFYNRALEKGRANFDITNRAVAYVTYALPIGRARRWMNQSGVLDYIFGGWNITWVQTYQTGLPVMFTMAGSPYQYLPGNGVLRPNQVGPNSAVIVPNWTIGDRFATSIENPIWNVSAFNYPAAFTAGTVGRDTINGPHLVWSQASASKDIHVREIATLQLRYDINNVFKNPNFVNPSSVVNIGNPGLFGKLTSTQGGWCCIGGQFVATFTAKLTF